METAKLRKFAQFARRSLIEQVTAKLKLVLAEENPARRERPQVIKKLEDAVAEEGKEQVIERVAYIWFNRFCALRFMDVNRYNRLGVVSPAEGQFQPEILADAKMGQIDEEMLAEATRRRIFALLDGKMPSQDPQNEAYRLLVVASCNHWHNAMPFLFERIDDYTELLMPGDLLSGNSILAYTREAMTPDACQDVEVIGWLYQYYISEKKDKVFEGLKKNTKITSENIPAATQLFTPHWIVRYLVENSLGRLWMLNRPSSKLVEQMDYYIKPAPAADDSEQPETDFLRINKPEEIKICDPACGSGHMLTYAFDLLYAIYEEEGYEPADIPTMILTHNLYGIEIDERAGELAAFALAMKAAAGNPKEEKSNHRRFFRNPIQPNLCVLENIRFKEGELEEYIDFIGRDLFTASLQATLRQFEEADNFGSLIRPDLTDADDIRRTLEAKDVFGQLFLSETHKKVLQGVRQADYLSQKYHVVVANPPYMGANNANASLKSWLSSNYPTSKRDLFSAFIERNLSLSRRMGTVAMITMQNWMFISRFESFRDMLFARSHFISMAHFGERAFDSISGEVVSTTAFILSAKPDPSFKATFIRLTDGKSEAEKSEALRNAAVNLSAPTRFTGSELDFKKIPGDPIAYWVPPSLRNAFYSAPDFDSFLEAREGLTTGKNEDYVRYNFEVSRSKVCRDACSRKEALDSGAKWFPYNKGGERRKWFGNDEYVVNWENDGNALQTRKHPSGDRIWAHNFNLDFIFRPSISWSDITTKGLSARLFPKGFIFDATGLSAFNRSDDDRRWMAASICNSAVGSYIAAILNPTLHFKAGDFAELPLLMPNRPRTEEICRRAVEISASDWDNYESSWNFNKLHMLSPDHESEALEAIYSGLRVQWQEMVDEMLQLEEENNHLFIDAFSLQDELTSKVPLEEITLTCNPHYRYGNKKSEQELETLLLADTIRELVSYAVGCMFGRYSLNKPGLILANQGDAIEDYLKQIPEPNFPADDDNVIPMLDGDWFSDDIAERFREFLRAAFGDEHYEANLRFVEQALDKDIRKYLLKDFYNDHVRRYKKRPIYWLFSSPKGSFNALIYMHRYQPHTVGKVLEYLRDFKDEKLQARKNHLKAVSISSGASQADKSKALKKIEDINKILSELDDYERDMLYPLATKQVEIDLDDGVKVNYPKFGHALKKITGLS